MSELLTIPEAAEKYGIDVKRLRGKVWEENQTGHPELPIGSYKTDQVYDDWRLQKLARTLGDRA